MDTFMRRTSFGALAVLAGNMLAAQSSALEPGDFGQYPHGVTLGDPIAAAPPPGLYFENTTLFAPQAQGYGQLSGIKIDASLDVATLVWSTGWRFIGASVTAYVSQPVSNLLLWNSSVSGPPFAGTTFYPTLNNTWISPVALSWNLGGGWFAAAGFAFTCRMALHTTTRPIRTTGHMNLMPP